MQRFVPLKRTAIDGKVWWCIYDTANNCFSTLLCHGKYKRRKDAEFAIEKYKSLY